MSDYRPPTFEGRKQIVMRFLRGDSADSITRDFLDRRVQIGNIEDYARDPSVRSGVCMEMGWGYATYESRLNERIERRSA